MNKPKKHIFMKILITLYMVLVAAFFLNIFRDGIKNIVNFIVPPQNVTKLNLTKKQKLEDFEYLYNTITTSMPMINSYKDNYEFSFSDRKSVYEDMILKTESDLEFYTAIDSIIQDIPSFHTDLIEPGGANRLNCFNSRRVATDRHVLSLTDYWNNLLDSESEQCKDMIFYAFNYTDGSYYYDALESNDNEFSKYDRIVSVDHTPVDKYIINEMSIYNLHYDGQYSKCYRGKIMFNNMSGKKVNVEIEHSDHTISTQELYISNYYNDLFCWYKTNNDTDNEESDLFIYEDNSDKVSYLRLDSMGKTDGDKVLSSIKKLKYDNVVLDLRNNYGGNTDYAAKYIYPYLFSNNIFVQNSFYMPATLANKSIISYNIMNLFFLLPSTTVDSPYPDKGYKYWKCQVEQSYKGKLYRNKNVIILAGSRSGSAADRFISDMKNNKSAIVIGNNTGGEGLCNSFNCVSLPNSGLVFIYMPGGAKNLDGTDNSAYGTSPDEYVSESIESYYALQDLNSDDSVSLEKDNVIRYAIEKCKKMSTFCAQE